MLTCRTEGVSNHGRQRFRSRHPRQRQYFWLRRRINLPLDLNSEATLNRSNHIRPDVVLYPADDDVIGQVSIRNERNRRIERGVGEVAVLCGMAFAIVCKDGVRSAGNDISLTVDDGVSDEAGGGPKVGNWHISWRIPRF